MDEHRVDIGGITLRVRTAGDEGCPVLVLLHGWPDSGRCWDRVVPHLEDRYRLVVPDLRGFGRSDMPEGVDAYRMHVLVADVAGLIDWAGGGPVSIAGHDFGGALTWQAGTWLADLLHRAVVLAAPHPLRMREVGSGNLDQLSRSFYVWLLQNDAGLDLLASGDFSFLAAFAFGGSKAFSDEDRDAYRSEWRQPGRFRAMANWYRANFRPELFNPDVPLELPPVAVPTRYVHGERDWAFASGMATGSGAFVGAEYDEQVIAGASHWMPQERPDEVARLIDEWVGSP
jgi:pimeloyl-ACP methyl ester carboxylesterase